MNTDQYTSAGKAIVESQQAAFSEWMKIALQGTERLVALNIAVAKASAEDSANTARDWLSAKDPQTLISLLTSCLKPRVEQAAGYSRNVTEIISSIRSDCARVADAQVADAQDRISSVIENLTKSAPAGSENIVTMLRSSVDMAKQSYEKINSAARQAFDATEAQVVKASDQFTQAATQATKKAAARNS